MCTWIWICIINSHHHNHMDTYTHPNLTRYIRFCDCDCFYIKELTNDSTNCHWLNTDYDTEDGSKSFTCVMIPTITQCEYDHSPWYRWDNWGQREVYCLGQRLEYGGFELGPHSPSFMLWTTRSLCFCLCPSIISHITFSGCIMLYHMGALFQQSILFKLVSGF